MDQPKIHKTKIVKKRKHSTKHNLDMPISKATKPSDDTAQKINRGVQKLDLPKVMHEGFSMEEIGDRYPILKNEELVNKFLSVPITNNQKGRIRQLLKDNLRGSSDILLPDIINNKIQVILKSSTNLTDTDLRKIRILYNMLKTSVKSSKALDVKDTEKRLKKAEDKIEDDKKEGKKVAKAQVKKKRYVVFIGNLPKDIEKQTILDHFSELSEYIKDIRIPKRGEEKKSSIAYLEMSTEPSYELALCKHHSMLGNKRINVLYTAPKKGKLTKAQAKSKSAKLVAMQKSGKLLGSVPINRKRSQRRAKLKKALALNQSTA